MNEKKDLSRRSFIKASAAVSAGAILTNVSGTYAAGSDKIRVGIIGCGGRGTGAAKNCIQSSEGVEIYAMGDVFQDRLDGSVKKLTDYKPKRNGIASENFNVPKERQFAGFDAFRKVLACDVDMVILAPPPPPTFDPNT